MKYLILIATKIDYRIYQEYGFPCTIGFIDGTQIRISKPVFVPSEVRHKFICRKGFFSWNAMVVTDDNLKIRWLSCERAGSVHDSRIWNESSLKAQLLANYNPEQPLALIGDKGFPCSNVLLVPIKDNHIRNEADEAFNEGIFFSLSCYFSC